MIEFTIKTLDSNNHRFSVEDETTVQQLKEKVMEQMGIEINLQRLIFCGRVLQDEKKLSEYDVHGKVVHLVQRAPPSPENRTDRPTGAGISTHPEPNTQQQIRRLMEGMAGTPDFVLEQQQALTMSPTTGRLEFIRRMIADIKTSLTVLRAHVEGEEYRSTPASSDAPVDPPDTEPTAGATQEESEPIFDEFGEEAPDAATRATNARRRSYRAIRALRARHSRPRDLGQLLEELDTLQEQFAPYRSNYIRMLRAANSPEPPEFTEEERQTAQRTVDMVSDIIHSFAHAYHAVSDINFQVGQRIPRLTSESTLLRHQMPMQAHINVVQSTSRRPYQSQHASQNASTSNAASSSAGVPTTHTTTGPTMAPSTATSTVTSNSQDGLHTHTIPGRNTAQPTVNINIQPEPIYQVEIDARIPIAFPLDNSLFNGLSGMMVGNQNLNQQEPQTLAAPLTSQDRPAGHTDQGVQAGQTGQTSQVGETGQMGQGQTSQVGLSEQMGQGGQTGQAGQASQVGQMGQMGQGGQTNQLGQSSQVGPTGQMGHGGQAGQDSQAGQANRRQVLLDFENLFRGLNQTDGLGGVEVVMSMEELPQGGALGVGTIYSGNNATGMPQPVSGVATATAPPAAAATATLVGSAAGAAPAHFGQTFPPEEGVFVPLPWGPPNADLLQNIVQTMIRQSLPEGMTVQFPGTGAQLHHVPGDTVTFTPLHQFLQTHPHAHIQQVVQAQYNPQAAQQAAQAQQPTQAQQVLQTQQPGQAQQAHQPVQVQQAQQPGHVHLGHIQTGHGPSGHAQPGHPLRIPYPLQLIPHTGQIVQSPPDQHNRNAQQPQLHFRRATATRTQAVPLVNCIYDRFLQCESTHARRRILRRREQHQQQVAAQERLRNERIAALNIETLRDRNINLTENNISSMVHLLRSPPSQEAWLNALFVTIARHFYLADPMQSVPGEPQLVPNEFSALRTLLRSYIHNLIARSGDRDGENSFMICSDFLVNQQADFVNNMNNITPVREDVDILASLRGLIRSRMPAVVAVVMCDVSGEVFAARFYGVFARLFADSCALISHCLEEGLDGFRLVYREYMDHIVKNFDPTYHQLFLTLATANFNGMVNNLSNRNIRQYVVRNEGVVDLESDLEEPSPMEVSPAPVVREEPMQLSPPPTPAVCEVQAQAETPAPEAVVEPVPVSVTSQASTSSASPAPVTPAQTVTTASTQSPSSPQMRTYARINKEKSEPSTPTHNGNRDENLGLVPPLMIVQHWGEEWVPVFTHDQEAQRSEPQEPYSDAYLSGMPSRKRRCVRQARPPTTLDGFMNESIREAADHDMASAVDNSGIRNAFREHMRSIARTRASSSEDYDPLRYTSAARFLNSTRSTIPQPQENGTNKKED